VNKKRFIDKYGPWAVVTGASDGIGLAFSDELASIGLNLVLVARRADRLYALSSDLSSKYGTSTVVVPADLSTPIITGLLNASDGDVEVLGEKLSSLTNEQQIAFRQRDLGFVFQQFNLLPSLTAAENVAVPLFVAGTSWDEGVKRASALLETLGMGERISALPSALSGGQQQRVALGRAMIHNPRLIVCDEPTSALDAKSGLNVMDLLSRVAVQPERAVIVVTH
jgi:putative ABC transport system ATP-binding protein